METENRPQLTKYQAQKKLQNNPNMNHEIIQWNCRRIKDNRSELLLLVMNLQPAIICLQEIFLKANDDININTYESFNRIYNTGHRASGIVLILIKNDISQSKINLNIGLQAIAVKVTLHRTLNICTWYISPHNTINEKELNNITITTHALYPARRF